MRSRSKTCPVCEAGSRVLDYKDDRTLSRFLTDRGKILPSRLSGMCARHQRQLTVFIREAKFKVTTQIQDQQIRVTSKSRDDLGHPHFAGANCK